MKLTFKHPDDTTVEKAVARFRQNPEYLAIAGIKIKNKPTGWDSEHGVDVGWFQERNKQVDAEIVAAICRAWLAATED